MSSSQSNVDFFSKSSRLKHLSISIITTGTMCCGQMKRNSMLLVMNTIKVFGDYQVRPRKGSFGVLCFQGVM